MKHSFLDRYSDGNSIIHRLDPRTKLATTLVLVLAVVLTPPDRWLVFGLYLGLLSVLIGLTRVPPGFILKRSLVIIPFALLVAAFIPFIKEGGLGLFLNVLAKAWLSVLSLVLLTSTTTFPRLLRGLEQLHLPRVMVMLLSFFYRYLFILVDEAMRLKQARDSRATGGRRLWRLRTIGNMIGTLFLRSYERGERVYAAMVARGFNGRMRTPEGLRFRPADAFFASAFGLVLALAAVGSWWHYG